MDDRSMRFILPSEEKPWRVIDISGGDFRVWYESNKDDWGITGVLIDEVDKKLGEKHNAVVVMFERVGADVMNDGDEEDE